ncbi:uncharacterized [Tachysurus ichikawai]
MMGNSRHYAPACVFARVSPLSRIDIHLLNTRGLVQPKHWKSAMQLWEPGPRTRNANNCYLPPPFQKSSSLFSQQQLSEVDVGPSAL